MFNRLNPIATTLLALVKEASEEGVIALDLAIDEIFPHNSFAFFILRLVVDGTPTEVIYEITQNLMVSGNYKGYELLENSLVIDTALNLSRGASYKECEDTINYYLGGSKC